MIEYENATITISLPQVKGKANFQKDGRESSVGLLEENSAADIYIELKRAMNVLEGAIDGVREDAMEELSLYIGSEMYKGIKLSKGAQQRINYGAKHPGWDEFVAKVKIPIEEAKSKMRHVLRQYENSIGGDVDEFSHDVIDEASGEVLITITHEDVPTSRGNKTPYNIHI